MRYVQGSPHPPHTHTPCPHTHPWGGEALVYACAALLTCACTCSVHACAAAAAALVLVLVPRASGKPSGLVERTCTRCSCCAPTWPGSVHALKAPVVRMAR